MLSQLADFVSLMFPRVCYSCNESLTSSEEFICLSCELSLPKTDGTTNKGQLLKKFAFQPKVVAAHSFLNYQKFGMAQRLVQGIKYHGKKDLGVWLGVKFGEELLEQTQDLDVIIPLPLHKRRLRSRGYNQSEVIASGIATPLGLEVDSNCVSRIRYTKTQTSMSKLNRWENIRSVFSVSRPKVIYERNVLLVDDVVTTGATMGILCDEIAKCDPASITIATLASGQ